MKIERVIRISSIKYDNIKFFFKEKIEYNLVYYKSDRINTMSFVIKCKELNIRVWGSTIKTTKQALAFSIYSIYINTEKKEKISKQLEKEFEKLKGKIKKIEIIKTIILNN